MASLGVLYYLNKFPKMSESFILNEIHELQSQGHKVAVFALHNPNEELVHHEYENIDIPIFYSKPSYSNIYELFSRKGLSMDVLNKIKTIPLKFSSKQIGRGIFSGNQCADYIETLDFDIDVIHGHFADPYKIGEIYASAYHDIPCTVTAHAYEIFKNPNVPRVRYICEEVDHVITPSEYNREYVRREIGADNNITVIPATTTIEKFTSVAETIPDRLVTVGRLTEKKGYKYGIRAVADLIEKGYDIEYHIIGTGEQERQLQKYVQEHDLREHIKFLGHISDERLQRELSEACIFLLPCVIANNGDRDAMPVVLKEAMAAETACVSTTISAIPELITDEHDGLLVPPNNSEALKDAIQHLLDDSEKRQKIAQNGRITVENEFDISKSVEDLVEVFEKIQ